MSLSRLLFLFLVISSRTMLPAQVAVYNPTFSGTAQSDIDLGTHTVRNGSFNGSSQLVQLDGAGRLPPVDGSQVQNVAWSHIQGFPSTLSGYGIADPVLLSTGSYSNPAWLTSLDWSKVSGVPAASATISGTVKVGAGLSIVSGVLGTLMPGRNVLVGGDFSTNPWQRGTTFAGIGTTQTFGPDHWFSIAAGGSNMTVSRQTGIGLAGFTAAVRLQRLVGNTGSGSLSLRQVVETANIIPLQGATCTLSFWARAGANYSGSGNAFYAYVAIGTGTDQGSASYLIGTWASQANCVGQGVTLNTAWARYAVAVPIPATATELAVSLEAPMAGTAGAADYVEIAGVQLEAGGAPTSFEALPPEAVLVRCLRYYQTHPVCVGTSSSVLGWALPVAMRTSPAVSGGGSGFTTAVADPQMVNAYQTTAGTQTLVFNAEL